MEKSPLSPADLDPGESIAVSGKGLFFINLSLAGREPGNDPLRQTGTWPGELAAN